MAIGTTAASSARSGAMSSTMSLRFSCTGRSANSERLTFAQIAVSGSGASFVAAPAMASTVHPASRARSRARAIMCRRYSAPLRAATRVPQCADGDCSLSEQLQRRHEARPSLQIYFLIRAYIVFRHHPKEENMASNRTYVCGALLGLAFVPGIALCADDMAQLTANPNNWAMQAGNVQNHRYSPLKQINSSNVKNLKVAWMFSTGVLRGHEGGPIVIGDMLYVH